MALILSTPLVAPTTLGLKVGTVGLLTANIQSIQTRTATPGFPGVTEIVYSVNSTNGNFKKTVKLYSSTAAATLITAANT